MIGASATLNAIRTSVSITPAQLLEPQFISRLGHFMERVQKYKMYSMILLNAQITHLNQLKIFSKPVKIQITLISSQIKVKIY